ncbi:MAG TPA: YncE family protein [Steroidobacteraceae bacterium]|jgi:DNA-binding beta-propeller fold protein YncE
MRTWCVRLAAALGLTLLAAAGAAAADQLLVLEKDTHQLAIIDPVDLRVLARIASGPDPHEVVASSDGRVAYISNYGGEGSDLHTISRVDLLSRTTLAPIDLGALHSAHGLDFAGGELYFTAESSKVIGRYDPASARIDWVMGTGQDRTHMVWVAPDLKHIYTTNVRSGSVSILESVTRAAFAPPPGFKPPAGAPPRPPGAPVTLWNITVVPAGRGAEGFDLSPDGRQLWTANAQDGTVTVIDLAAKKAVETFAVPVHGANRLKFTPDGAHVLISGLGNFGSAAPDHANLIVVDVATRRTIKSLDLGGGAAGILIPPGGSSAFVAVSGGGKVAVVDLKTFNLRGQIAPLGQPDGMAWVRGR